MVLGHDFHNVAGYNKAKHNVKENLRSPTWRNLIKFLDDTSIDLRHCFFTNVFMGLRQGVAVTGPFPGRSSPEFVARCQEFFLRQVALQQPKIVLALGTHVPKFLAPLSRQLTCWKSPADFRGRDANNLALIANVKFHRAPQRCVVVSIVHPSFHDQNVRLRHWRGRVGDAAELALVFEAKRRTNI